MKQLLLAAAIICTVAAQAQGDKYNTAMQQQLQKFDSTINKVVIRMVAGPGRSGKDNPKPKIK